MNARKKVKVRVLIDILRIIDIVGVIVCLFWVDKAPTWEKSKRPICLAIEFLFLFVYLSHLGEVSLWIM